MSGSNFGVPISSATNVWFSGQDGLALLIVVNTAPESQANTYSKGCLALRTDTGTLYQNTGSSDTPTWTVNGVGAQGPTGPTGPSVTGYTGYSGYSGPSTTGYTGYSGYSGYTGHT